ncbi:hypothetical protein EDC53_102344 [Phytobacter diazotrophicus]|nr:hypothetical protein EDC53_102344 [Phytobacter diazotrophicus]
MAFGWQIFNSGGILVADNSVIMSRRLGTYTVPFLSSAWSTTIGLSLSGGTPYCHVYPVSTAQPSDGAYYTVAPDLIFSGNTLTIRYTDRHFAWPKDDSGTDKYYIGGMVVCYGVYNQ